MRNCKQILCALLASLNVVNMFPVYAFAADEEIQPVTELKTQIGDINCDGSVDQGDVTILSRYFAGWKDYDELILDWDAADFDQNGSFTRKDLMCLARYEDEWEGYTLPNTPEYPEVENNFRIASTTVDKDTAIVGSIFEWTAEAVGGEGQVNYSFELKKLEDAATYSTETSGIVVASQDYGPENYFCVNMSEAGNYAVTVSCKDASDTVCTLQNVCPVIVTNTELEKITVVSDAGKSVCQGETFTWNVKTFGGNAPFTYQYSLLCDQNEIDFITSEESVYTYENCQPGEYQLMVRCTDADGVRKTVLSDAVRAYTTDEYSPAAPEVRVAGDVVALSENMEDTNSVEAQSLLLEWDAVSDAKQYFVELAYCTGNDWYVINTGESITANRYTLSANLFQTAVAERLYRIGVYSKGIAAGEMRYYYFRMSPVVVNESIVVNGTNEPITWDIATANKVSRPFDVSSELDYSVSSDADWITCVKGDDGFIATIAENSDHVSTRSGIITVDNGENSVTIPVNQGNGQGAPVLLYPYLSSDADNPTERPAGGITIELEDDSANYIGVRVYELSEDGKKTIVYENIIENDAEFLHITDTDQENKFSAGKQYLLELAGHYSTSYAQNEYEDVLDKNLYYIDMVSDGHKILVEGTDYYEAADFEDVTVALYSTNAWTYTVDAEWIHVEDYEYVSYCKDIENVKIKFDPNYTQDSRSGIVTFHCGSESASVKVTQDSWLPRFVYPEVSQDINNPTILPSSGLMDATVYQYATYATYDNGAWSEETDWGSTSSAVTEFFTLFPDDYFDADVLYRFTMHTGDHTNVYYAKFNASSTQNYVALKDGVDEVKTIKWDVSSEKTERELKMKANASWTITSDSSWLTSSSTSGSARTSWKTLTITSEANTTGKERTGVLSFKIGSTVYATLTVTQPATDYMELFCEDKEDIFDYIHYNSDTSFKLCDGSGETLSLYVWSNDTWGATSNNTWITVDGDTTVDGVKSGSNIDIDLEENTGSSVRTGTITVYSGKVSKTVTITQVPGMKAPTLVSPILSTSSKSPSAVIYNDIYLTWNAVDGAKYYEVKVDPADNAVLLPNSHFYSYIVKIEDTGKDTYSCVIPKTAFSLNADSYDDIDIYAYDEYGYSVYEYFYLISSLSDSARINGTMTPTWDNADDIEVSKEFTVNSTSDWTASSKSDWITIDRTSGSNGDVLTVSLAKNTGSVRTGQVLVTVGSTVTVLTVNQCAYLPEYPSITSPNLSDDEGNPTILAADTTSITVTWNSAPQAENYRIKLLSYSTTSAGHVEQQSGLLTDGEDEYIFTDLNLIPGQMYMISITRKSHWGNTGRRYYFIAEQSNAWIEPKRTSQTFSSDEDYSVIDIRSSGVWSASTDTEWIMLENEHITQELLDEYCELSSYYHSYSGVSDEPLYISVLANPGNTYRYGTVTVRCGAAEEIIEIAQKPYYELAEIYSPILADSRQNSVGVPYSNVTVRWDECVGGAGTYQIILEEREEDSTYQYYDILEETNITKTSYTIPVSKLKEGGYYCLTLCSDLIDVDTDDSPCKRYYFYVKYENELTVSADVEWDISNKTVLVSASATGGAGGYQFAYELLCDGEQVGITDIDDWDYYTFPITNEGEYQVRVYCRDVAGFSDELYSSPYDFNNTVSDYVALSQNSWSIDTSGGSVSIIIQSNSAWAIESCPSWVSCSSDDGKNGDSVILSVGANTSTERTGNITFVSGAARTSLSVVQESAVLKTVITYPLNSAVIDIGDIPVKWNQMKEADSYLISVRDLTTDVLLVNQHPTTDVMYTISSTSLVSGHNYRVAVGTVVEGKTWWTESTFSIKKPEDTSPVEHSYQRVTVGTQLINQNLSAHDIITTYYEKCSICGDTAAQKTDSVIVAHNFTYTGYESAHPHAKFQRCDCGAAPYIDGAFKTANGQVQDKADCCICHGHKYDTANPSEKNGKWYVACLKCGITKNVDAPAVCTHPNGFIMGKTVHNGTIYMNYNDPYKHTCYGASYTVYCCSYCGEADWSTVNYLGGISGKYTDLHTFNEQAVCKMCGYVSLNGAYDYTDRFKLYIDTKYYFEDEIYYIGIGETCLVKVYDVFNNDFYVLKDSSIDPDDVVLSLKDPNGIASLNKQWVTASNSGVFEVILTYCGKVVDTIKIGATVLSVEDEFFKYSILSSGVVRVDDLNNIDWKDGNALITPWVAMGNYSAKQNSDDSHTITFEVYNSSAEILGFGIYDSTGKRTDNKPVLIKPYWETGSIVGGAWRTFSKTAQIWNMSKSFDGAGTETTKITLTVPEGGYIQLMDISEDMKVFSANVGEFILGTIKLADDVEGLINPADAKVMQELVDALGEDEFVTIIYNYIKSLYGDNIDDFIALYLKENGNKFVIESMVETLLKGGLMDAIIDKVPETVIKTIIDKTEDGILMLVPGLYLLKHGSQTLYDFGGMAQLSVAFNRCINDKNEKYISHIIMPHHDVQMIDVDYDKLWVNSIRSVVAIKDTELRADPNDGSSTTYSVTKGTELALMGSKTNSADGILYYMILYNDMTVYVPAVDIKLT